MLSSDARLEAAQVRRRDLVDQVFYEQWVTQVSAPDRSTRVVRGVPLWAQELWHQLRTVARGYRYRSVTASVLGVRDEGASLENVATLKSGA